MAIKFYDFYEPDPDDFKVAWKIKTPGNIDNAWKKYNKLTNGSTLRRIRYINSSPELYELGDKTL